MKQIRSKLAKKTNKTNLKRIVIWVAIILAVLAVLFFTNIQRSEPYSDEGIALTNAWRFWNNDTQIYTKHFIEYVAPGTTFVVFWAWKIAGTPSYLVAKLSIDFFWLLGTIGIYLIIRKKVTNGYLIYLSLAFWLSSSILVTYINHNMISTAASVWVLYFLLLSQDESQKNKRIILVLLGIACSITLWFLQTKGLILFLTSLVVLFFYKSQKKSNLLYLIFSFLISATLLLSLTGFTRTFQALFILPWHLNYLYVNRLQTDIGTILLFTSLSIGLFLFAYIQKRQIYWTLAFYQLGIFLSVFNNLNISHVLINLYPCVIFYVLYCSEQKERLSVSLKKLNKIYCFAISTKTTLLILFCLFFTTNIFNYESVSLFKSPEIVKAKSIYAGPYIPGYYYEAKKTTFYSLSHTDVINPELEAQTLEEIKRNKPEIAFMNTSLLLEATNLDLSADNLIDNYIKNNYLHCQKESYKKVDVYVTDLSFCPSKIK